MRRIFTVAFLVVSAFAFRLEASERELVVVELFTSQGCSSCPPADEFLHDLAKRKDVLALGLHVDYWDYIGWKDVFASPAFSDRQRSYARANGRRSVYTPQMIISGREHVVGNHPQDVNALIAKHQAEAPKIAMRIASSEGLTTVNAKALQGNAVREVAVIVVQYLPEGVTRITRGENAGETLTYANIVTRLEVAKIWNTKAPLALSVKSNAKTRTAVILQERGFGEILAAARIP